MKRGSEHKQSSIGKMAQAHKGKPLSEAHRLALIGSHDGYRHSEATKRKIGLANAILVDRGILKRLYIEEKLPIKQVALQMNISHATIHRNLKSLGIVRSNSEARRLS